MPFTTLPLQQCCLFMWNSVCSFQKRHRLSLAFSYKKTMCGIGADLAFIIDDVRSYDIAKLGSCLFVLNRCFNCEFCLWITFDWNFLEQCKISCNLYLVYEQKIGVNFPFILLQRLPVTLHYLSQASIYAVLTIHAFCMKRKIECYILVTYFCCFIWIYIPSW